MTEMTKGGSRVLRYGPPTEGYHPPAKPDTDAGTAVVDHFGKHVGEATNVFHEIVSDVVHIDVHVIPPAPPGRPTWTLFTTGMSDRRMNVPTDFDAPNRAELVVRLPGEWPVSTEGFRDERFYWPVRWMKKLARFVHEFDTAFAEAHTIPNGDPSSPFAPDTEQCCILLMPPISFPEEMHIVHSPGGTDVALYALCPLYKEEMAFKLEHGTEALWEKLRIVHPEADLIAPTRARAVTRKRLFGLF